MPPANDDYRRRLASRTAMLSAKRKREKAFSSPPPNLKEPVKPVKSILERALPFVFGGMGEEQAKKENRYNLAMMGADGKTRLDVAGLNPIFSAFTEGYGGGGAIGSVAKKTLTKTARGTFEPPRKGLGALAEIITGDPKMGSFVMRRYPVLGALARSGQPSFRGIDDSSATQIPFFARTAKGGFERAQNWLNIPFEDVGRLLGTGEASIEELSKAVRGRGFDFGNYVPSEEAVKRALDIRRADLGNRSSSFGFILDPTARAGRRAVTSPKEHIISAAYVGGDTASNTLSAIRQGASLDNIGPLLDKLEKQGRRALNPDELLLVDDFFNSSVKGTLPYEIAREEALKMGDLPFVRTLSDDAATHNAYVDFLSRMREVSDTLTDPLRIESFAKNIKPRVRFGESTFRTAKEAFEPSKVTSDVRKQLADWLVNM
jgi:hypothetical protein